MIILANQCHSNAGRVPSAIIREPGIFPIAVRSAATIRSAVDGSHCAPSSASTRRGASPCARRGSEPMHRTRAPVALFVMDAALLESCTRHADRSARS